jgi:hypothetical protein
MLSSCVYIFKKIGIVLDDKIGLSAETLNIGHDVKRQHRFTKIWFADSNFLIHLHSA